MSERSEHIAFDLKDFFQIDPFRVVYSKRKDPSVLNAYLDYSQYLESLRIAWQRLKQDCKEVGRVDNRIRQIPLPNEKNDNEAALLWIKQWGLMNIVQFDVESFINIARIMMDKLAKLIEQLLGLSRGRSGKRSFTDHQKDFPVKHRKVHPVYADFLENKTYWYNQELLLLRDKIFSHSDTFITPWGISLHRGVIVKKMDAFGPLKEPQKTRFLAIKNKYEARYSELKVTNNDYEMLDDFLLQIRSHDIKLDLDRNEDDNKTDLDKLGDIVSSRGVSIDEEFLESIARHIEDFMKEVMIILADSGHVTS